MALSLFDCTRRTGRLRGKTRKLRVQILVSGRNRSGYPKPLAGNFPTQDQYISIIIAGLCVERAMPDPHSHEVKAGGGLAHWRNLKKEQVFIFKMPCAHLYQLATSIVFSCAEDTASQEINAKKEHPHTLIWLTLFLNSLISLYRKSGGKWCVDHFLSIAGALYEIKFHYVVKLFDFYVTLVARGAIHRLVQCLFKASWLRWSHHHADCVTWLAICQSQGKRHWHRAQLSCYISQSLSWQGKWSKLNDTFQNGKKTLRGGIVFEEMPFPSWGVTVQKKVFSGSFSLYEHFQTCVKTADNLLFF